MNWRKKKHDQLAWLLHDHMDYDATYEANKSVSFWKYYVLIILDVEIKFIISFSYYYNFIFILFSL